MTTEEIKILSSVESVFLVKFIEAFQLEEYLNPSYYCIVMELCEVNKYMNLIEIISL
jgi:hypothetical protein